MVDNEEKNEVAEKYSIVEQTILEKEIVANSNISCDNNSS